MVNLLKAAKVRKEFIDAVKVHRCIPCERTEPKRPTHKTRLPHEYVFNHTLGIDVLELTDTMGQKYQVLNMVCMGTTFQLAEVVKVGAGQPSSHACLSALQKRWFAWAGHPVNLFCDRGLHNRGILAKYLDEHGIQSYHVPLESPEELGRVERHGGLLKAMFRKVAAETSCSSKEQVESILTEVTSTKNDMSKAGGFSPSQWVMGKAPRDMPSLMSEERFAELGVIEARHDPTSIFALQHLARTEARKAYVHLDCSRRVQRAMSKNVSGFHREHAIGDLVVFRKDNNRGGVQWSPTCRVIGWENQKNVWLLSGNVPVLVASNNIRPASASEALAVSVLRGEPLVPSRIVGDGQQSFLDARTRGDSEEEGARDEPYPSPSPMVVEEEDGIPSELPPVPEDSDDIWVGPDFFEEEDDDLGAEAEDDLADLPLSRRRPAVARVEAPEGLDRNVRPRTGEAASASSSSVAAEPEAERGVSLGPSRQLSETPAAGSTDPVPWPNVHNVLDDLPLQLRQHFERQRANETPTDLDEATALFASFMGLEEEPESLGKKVLKSIDYNTAPPEVQEGLQGAMVKEWGKFEQFGAAIPIVGELKDQLLAEGHQVIPSKWVHTDKAEFKKGRPDYAPEWKSRLVSCGNFEVSEGLRSDSPTAEVDVHHVMACWCSCKGVTMHSADITNAYFQGKALDRIVLMSQPRNGLPGVDPDALLLMRVRIYGLTDSGTGFFLQLDEDARAQGIPRK